jgi:cell cycle sensor histidine kinase DivJ
MPEILADRRAVNQILLNLISNAVKFTERGGHISVSASCEGGCAVLQVADDGAGIDADDLPRLGDPFFQAGASYDRRHEGTGLGLSIVKGLVKLHGGDFDIRSRVGEGTRVIVRLPIDGERLPKPESRAVTSQAMTEPVTVDYRVKKIA